jgi:phosphotransferase system enzyme I (PtsI)
MSPYEETGHRSIFRGIGVSPGIVFGHIHLLDRQRVSVRRYDVTEEQVEAEISRFKRAVETSKDQLEDIKNLLTHDVGKDLSNILIAHMLTLEDKMLVGQTMEEIRSSRVNAEWALKKVLEKYIQRFDAIADEEKKRWKTDIEHVGERVLRNLAGRQMESLGELPEGAIVVAHDLAPSDTLQLKKGRVVGFVTEVGGRTSHTAIMARSLEIPAVVGLDRITTLAETGDSVIVDGNRGIVILRPDEAHRVEYEERQRRYRYYERELTKLRDLPARTQDDTLIHLAANLELPEELPTILEHGAAGIGLFRTEFLFMNRPDLPSEEDHFKVYRAAAERLAPHPVIIRTLDMGGDKVASHLAQAEESNPALGLRAIRFCLREQDLFRTQLRAILRASAFGDVRVMYPMISGLRELREANLILEDVKRDLRREGVPFREEIPVGIMIEVPSAALIADILAKEVSFFSVGTNDLIQYSLAIDRMNEHVAYLYEPLHPAVVRTLQMIVEAGRRRGIPVGMCGEMAGDPLYSLVLVGLGFRDLSMLSFSIPRVKKILRACTYAEARALAEEVLRCDTAAEAHDLVLKYMIRRFPEDISEEGGQVCLL